MADQPGRHPRPLTGAAVEALAAYAERRKQQHQRVNDALARALKAKSERQREQEEGKR